MLCLNNSKKRKRSISIQRIIQREGLSKKKPLAQTPVLFPDPQNQIHASNINTEISNNLLTQLLGKMDAILTNQEEIKELIRLRKKKSH